MCVRKKWNILLQNTGGNGIREGEAIRGNEGQRLGTGGIRNTGSHVFTASLECLTSRLVHCEIYPDDDSAVVVIDTVAVV